MAQTSAIVPQAAPKLSIADTINFANSVAGGSLLPREYQRNPANVIIAVNLGQSMGLSPAESLYRINVIQGKPTASAELIAAQVRKAGHKLRISKDEARQSVTATIVRCDDPDYPISETRDAAWAQRMGLASKDNYCKQPMTMLTWRAITAAAREACPEALYGVAYTPDEMHDMDPEPAQPKPVQVQATAEAAADYMQPVRAAFPAWRDLKGLSGTKAAEKLAMLSGAKSMHDMSAEQASKAIGIMEADLERAAMQQADEAPQDSVTDVLADAVAEPELADEDMNW